MVSLVWCLIVSIVCCSKLASSATFTYTSFAAVPVSGTLHTSGSSSTLFKNATKLVVDIITTTYGGNGGVYYIADSGNHVIKRVPISTGIPVVVAGTLGVAGYAGDLGFATSAQLNTPMDVTYDASSNLYIADTNNHAIRMVSYATGIITTIVGVIGVPGSGGSTCAGAVAANVGTSCNLFSPQGIYSTPAAILYIADTGNHCIKKHAAPSSYKGVLWGQMGISGTDGENVLATATTLYFKNPTCIYRDPNLAFWICDTESRIRRINALGGTISTVAGSALITGSTGDDGPASSALLNNPMQVSCVGATTTSTLCYIADTNNGLIRGLQYDTTNLWNIFTVVGTGIEGYSTGNGTSLLSQYHIAALS